MLQLFMVLLCGDIGASNSRLAILDIDKQKIQAKEFFKNSDFSNFQEVLMAFQKKHKAEVKGACFGVAGPVENARVEITNLPWTLSAIEIAKVLKTKESFLINDLEGIAYGIPCLESSDIKEILPGKPQLGHRAVIAPGSGIGESILFWDGKRHRPIATEGGHSSFSPTSPLQLELLHYLNKELKHVSWERVLSGPGIFNIYQFLKIKGFAAESKVPKTTSAEVTDAALNEKDELSLKTLELFFEILATEAGNLALKCIPQAGLYIAGGITPKLIKLFDQKLFAKNFTHKGRMSGLLENIPVRLILNEEVGILGAAQYLAQNGRAFNS